MIRSAPRRAFTLIELLVVVAIIGLLISILLPSLAAAREQSRAAVCLSNMKQVMTIMHLYAQENGTVPGTYWQGATLNLDWSGKQNTNFIMDPNKFEHPIEASVLNPFVNSIDRIFECPTAKREANTIYDYTVLIRMAGAKIDLPWRMSYLADPSKGFAESNFVWFPGLPLLMEEDEFWYNAAVDDGSWAGNDQITARHRGSANMGYLDASVARFRSPKGSNPELEEAGDLRAAHLRLWASDKKFTMNGSNAKEFGWVNKPK